MDSQAYLDHMGTTKEDFKKSQLEPLALRRVQAQLILEHLREKFDDIDVTDDQVVAETKTMFE